MLHDTRGYFSMKLQAAADFPTNQVKKNLWDMRLKNMKYMKHMMYKDHKEPKNSMYGTQNKLFFFSSFFLQEYGRLEKIRFNRTQPKIHVSADAEKSHHISHISKYVPHSTEYTQSYPTISLPPNISNILQYPYSISIVSQNIPILSPKYPISIYFEG